MLKSIHIRVPPLLLDRIDRWAEMHSVDRSSAIRSILVQGLDTESLIFTIENAIRKTEITIPNSQIASLGTTLAYAILMSVGKSADDMSPILKSVHDALLQQ